MDKIIEMVKEVQQTVNRKSITEADRIKDASYRYGAIEASEEFAEIMLQKLEEIKKTS